MSWLARVGVFARSLCVLVVFSLPCQTQAQTASANSPPPRFPQADKFDPKMHPASGAQHTTMVPIAAGTYRVGSPDQHPLANRAAMPAHPVTLRAFKIDRTEVTNAQFAEFMNALPVKPMGTAFGGKVTTTNIPPSGHALFLEFSSRPSPYTMIDLDDEEARIGVRDGRFVPNPGHDNHPVTETTWAGALAYCQWRAPVCRARSSGKLQPAGWKVAHFPGAMECRPRSWLSSDCPAVPRCLSVAGRRGRHQMACSTWPAAYSSGRPHLTAPILIAPPTAAKT